MWWLAAAAFVVGYLLGSLPTAYLATKRVGGGADRIGPADIRRVGDGNAGAANVGRILGPRWGILVGAVDIAKGAVPVLLFNAPGGAWDVASPVELLAGAMSLPGMVAGAAAIAGHVWPVWLGFRGGRGAATAVGVTGAVIPGPMLIAALPALAILRLTRSSTLTLAFVYLASLILAVALFEAPWGIIGYCVTIFVAVGAVHFWSVRFRTPDG